MLLIPNTGEPIDAYLKRNGFMAPILYHVEDVQVQHDDGYPEREPLTEEQAWVVLDKVLDAHHENQRDDGFEGMALIDDCLYTYIEGGIE